MRASIIFLPFRFSPLCTIQTTCICAHLKDNLSHGRRKHSGSHCIGGAWTPLIHWKTGHVAPLLLSLLSACVSAVRAPGERYSFFSTAAFLSRRIRYCVLFAIFCTQNYFCTQKSDRKHIMCFPAGSVLFRFSIFCFFINTLQCLKTRPDHPPSGKPSPAEKTA